MSRLSKPEKNRPTIGQPARLLSPSLILVLLGYLCLCLYLYSSHQIQGDGAAYSLQALVGSPWERSIHVGGLAPLVFGVQVLGLPPNVLGIFWTGTALVASFGIGRRLLLVHPRARVAPPGANHSRIAPLLAPLSILASAATWEAALFVEIYAPLAALTLLTVWLVLTEKGWLAGLALGWAGATHPGVWALVPGLFLLTPRARATTWRRAFVTAAVIHALALMLLFPDWWSGGRGIAQLPPSDQSMWPALQSLWRLLAADLGIAAFTLMLALPMLGKRQVLGVLLLVLGTGAVLCRYSDNPGGLPALWLLLSYSPLASRAIGEVNLPRLRNGLAVLAGVTLLFGIADATSEQDKKRRAVEREHEARLNAGCPAPEGLSWSKERLWELSCALDSTDSATRSQQ